jgi:TolB-like protein/Flp pilus assembly protein TadD
VVESTIQHYRVLGKLGAGGMGEVYQAEDTRLRRTVALKFLPDRLVEDPVARERFEREARAIAALNHPNIVTIYDINADQGRMFLAMECVEGETVRARLDRCLSGHEMLGVEQAFDIARQIAAGLSAAHAKGIVHRDIKPQNVVIDRQGLVKILDFGLAKQAADETRAESLTSDGSILGTVAYMSPEQAAGLSVDHRTDLWSLAVVLYEMLTGRQPFGGGHPLSVIQSIIYSTPEPVSARRPELGAGVDDLLARALAKTPDSRYQSAQELLAAFEARRAGTASRQSRPASVADRLASIAVLPFDDMSTEKDQAYFCDGIAEELITALGRIENLRVAARTASFAFKGGAVDVGEIGARLRVQTVLSGSLRRSGSRIRVTAELVKVADASPMWSERFDREAGDIFAIQDEVTAAIIEHLKLTLLPGEQELVYRRATRNVEAHDLYLKGLHFLWVYSGTGFHEAIQAFERAVDIDPFNARAYWGLSDAYLQATFWGNRPPSETCLKVKTYARKALEIDPTLGDAHGALSYVHTIYDWNWPLAEREAREAVRLSPKSAMVRAYYSWFLLNTDRPKQAAAEALAARELDPESSFIVMAVGIAFIFRREFARAIEELEVGISSNPGFFVLHEFLGLALMGAGRHADAIREFERAAELSGRAQVILGELGLAYGQAGRRAEADEVFRELEERSHSEYVSPLSFVYMHLTRGNLREALRWLNRCGEMHAIWLCWLRVTPWQITRAPGETRLGARLRKAFLRLLVGRIIRRYRITEP